MSWTHHRLMPSIYPVQLLLIDIKYLCVTLVKGFLWFGFDKDPMNTCTGIFCCIVPQAQLLGFRLIMTSRVVCFRKRKEPDIDSVLG